MAAPIYLNAAEAEPVALPPIVFDATSGAPIPTPAGTTPEQVGAGTPAGAVVTAAPPAPASFPTATEIAAAFAALPRPEPAPPAATGVHVTAEALDYLRPDTPHSSSGRVRRPFRTQPRRRRPPRPLRPHDRSGCPAPGWGRTAHESGRRRHADHRRAGHHRHHPRPRTPGYRPDLYVGALEFPRPLVDGVSSAPINDATPFTVPRFVSMAGLTGDDRRPRERTPPRAPSSPNWSP